ncbi:hypothetical protein BHM04_00300 [Macrococcus sp. IME1552]|nr:LPXTG cell wall anchor domain-containing protein [Macrococcus sp. IME1552]ATD29727.1 hypothetical protein BHM04_00300 [Macrococcus sp. IME1552]
MKKILLSFAIMTSLTTVSTAHAEATPTVLYFHDIHDEPIKDFPFIINVNEEEQSLTALDDGYSVIAEDVKVIEIAGQEYEINPGELNNIEVVNPEKVIPSSKDMPVTETPLPEDNLTIKVHAVDRSFLNLEDGTIVYLKYDGELVDQAEVSNGSVTFNTTEPNKIYEVSFNKTIESDNVKIEPGEEKFLIFEAQTKPIKRDRSVESTTKNSQLKETIRKSPDDIPPLLARSKKEDSSNEVTDREPSRIRNSSNNINVKPQLPVKQQAVNPMKRNSESSVTSGTTSKENGYYSTESNNNVPSNNYSSNTTSKENTRPSFTSDDTSQQNTPSDGYASDSSYASGSNYNDYRNNSTTNGSSDQSDSASDNRFGKSSYNNTSTNNATTNTKSTNNEDQYLPHTGEAMSLLLPLAGLMTIAAGVALLYFTRKKRDDDII